MKLRTIAYFGVGYILGSRAGRERYGQISELAQRASDRLEGYVAERTDGAASSQSPSNGTRP